MAVDWNLLVKHEGTYLVANPQSHHHHAAGIHPSCTTTRPASERDMTATLDAANTEILDSIAESYSPHEFESVAKTLGYSQKELAAYRQSEANGHITALEARCLTDMLAYKVTGMLRNHAAVSTPAILQAGDEQLSEWRAWYVSEAKRLVGEMEQIEPTITTGQFCDHPGWAVRRSQLERVCELLWQVEVRLGIMLDAED